MSETTLQGGMLAGIVLGASGLGLSILLSVKVTDMRADVDELQDRSAGAWAEPPIPAAIREFAEAKTDPAIPVVATARRSTQRTDTEENDMPRQIEQAKLEAEREPETELREFARTDGSARTFQFRKDTTE